MNESRTETAASLPGPGSQARRGRQGRRADRHQRRQGRQRGSVYEQQDQDHKEDRYQGRPAGAVLDGLQVVAADAGLARDLGRQAARRTPESARWALTAFIAALVRGRNDGVLMSTRASSTTPSVLRNIDASDGVFSAVT